VEKITLLILLIEIIADNKALVKSLALDSFEYWKMKTKMVK